MKIPETSANVGAYYGNEENGQWQPNGVIIDSGVGGGVVGSGDAGVHRPPVYPVHIPRGHIPGYVMAGAFYPPAPPFAAPAPAPTDDFEDYMWMENEEEFDKQVMQQLEEEALMEQCIEAMLEDEQRERHRPLNGHNKHFPTTSNGAPLSLEETVSRSTLNPLAAEFVPTGARHTTVPAPTTEDSADSPEVPPTSAAEESKSVPPDTEPAPKVDSPPAPATDTEPHTTEEATPQPETPEVSAADVPTDKRPKDTQKRDAKKKEEPKKLAKQDSKPKAKPVPAKSEPKLVKKKEVKPVKSEAKVEEAVETPKPTPPTEESVGPKPINYAAAAKANKPKKATSPPPLKVEKKVEKTEKPAPKEKALPRKNSAK